MKKLSTHITESFQLNEKFDSNLLSTYSKGMSKSLKTKLFTYKAIEWSKLSDEDFEELDPKKAKAFCFKEARNRVTDESIAIWVKDGIIIGGSTGKWLFAKDYDGSGKSDAYSSVTAISKEADKVLFIPRIKAKKFYNDRIAKRNARWASREDSLAWKSADDLLDENQQKYRSILAKRKTEGISDEMKTKVDALFAEYSKVLTNAEGNPDWLQIRYVGENIKKVTDLYSKFIYIKKGSVEGKLYSHQKLELEATIKSINAKFDEINKEQELISK